MGKWMVSLVNSHTHATRIGWHLWEIDLKFAPGLPPGWQTPAKNTAQRCAKGWEPDHRRVRGGHVFKAHRLLYH